MKVKKRTHRYCKVNDLPDGAKLDNESAQGNCADFIRPLRRTAARFATSAGLHGLPRLDKTHGDARNQAMSRST